jgi:hypothetical protein
MDGLPKPYAPTIDQLHQMSERRPELYCDHVDVFEADDSGLIRLVFSQSRPEAGDGLNDPGVPVARIAMSRQRFETFYREACAKFGTRRDA